MNTTSRVIPLNSSLPRNGTSEETTMGAKDLSELLEQNGVAGVVESLTNTEDYTTVSLESLGVYAPRRDNRPPDVPAFVSFAGARVASPGNLTAIIAPPGTGKSAICESIIATAIDPESDGLGFTVTLPEGRTVIYIDTEQSKADHWMSWQRTMRRAGKPDTQTSPATLQFFSVRTVASIENRRRLLRCIAAGDLGAPGLLILDGVGDFVADPNDPAEVADLVNELLALADTHDFSVFVTIHPNIGTPDGKARGHLGSEIQRRAEAVLCVQRDRATNTRVVTTDSTHGKVRNAHDTLKHAFQWDENARMFTSCLAPAPSPKTDDILEMLDEAYKDQYACRHRDLVAAFMRVKKISEATAKRRIREAVELGLIKDRSGNGQYTRSTEDGSTTPIAPPHDTPPVDVDLTLDDCWTESREAVTASSPAQTSVRTERIDVPVPLSVRRDHS